MAVVAMKKLTLIGLTSEKKLILEALHYSNCTELKKTSEIPDTVPYSEDAGAAPEERRQRLESVIERIESCRAEHYKIERQEHPEVKKKKNKKPFFAYRRPVSFDEFTSVSAREYDLFTLAESIEKMSGRLTELKTERTRLENQSDQLRNYFGVGVPFSDFAPTKNAEIRLGMIPETMAGKLAESAKAFPGFYYEELSRTSTSTVFAVAYRKAEQERVKQLLSETGFSECPFRYEMTAEQKTSEIAGRLSAMEQERRELVGRIAANAESLEDLELLSDYYLLEHHKAEAAKEFQCTASAFILEAWFPAPAESAVLAAVAAKSPSAMTFVDNPGEGEEPPTLTQNVKLVAPYESVTNMFSVPRATERDPNLFVGMFFFLYFGIMLSDAGYGIVLAAATFLIMKLFRLESPMKKMMLVLCMGGISTIIWGALLGTWFGFNLSESGNAVLQKLMWFNPLEEPMLMLFICLGLGLVQILFGMGIRAADLFRQGKGWDAVFDIFSWYIFFIGIILLLAGMFLPGAPAALKTAGLGVAGAGLGIVILTAGRSKKGIFGKVLGGLGGVYNIVNFLSDILSYSRLFGLGVATGVIGSTMNLLAGLVMNLVPGLGYVFAAVVFVGGHIFNLAINTLGTYIHNSRLQYVEFFGRFFEGGGYEFQPLGWDTQYVQIQSKTGADSFAVQSETKKGKRASNAALTQG